MKTYKFNIDIMDEQGKVGIANNFGQLKIENFKNIFSEKTTEKIIKAIEAYESRNKKS